MKGWLSHLLQWIANLCLTYFLLVKLKSDYNIAACIAKRGGIF